MLLSMLPARVMWEIMQVILHPPILSTSLPFSPLLLFSYPPSILSTFDHKSFLADPFGVSVVNFLTEQINSVCNRSTTSRGIVKMQPRAYFLTISRELRCLML
jgi:hypothetical protein